MWGALAADQDNAPMMMIWQALDVARDDYSAFHSPNWAFTERFEHSHSYFILRYQFCNLGLEEFYFNLFFIFHFRPHFISISHPKINLFLEFAMMARLTDSFDRFNQHHTNHDQWKRGPATLNPCISKVTFLRHQSLGNSITSITSITMLRSDPLLADRPSIALN